MAYQVLARRWRPQKFEDVVGQDHVVKTLQNAISSDRIAHAYLFTGVRGVGKTSVARILAKALNCEKGPTPTPDNSCSICNEITAGSSVDVLEIDGASNTGVDDVRELRENVRYMPQASRYKIYIIDEVHMLSNAAFNALLKTLEEPPPHIIFIFATTEPQKIPATILSRCQRFDFKRIPREKILESLKNICNSEGVTIDESDLRLIAREAEGSMRDALSLLDQIISFSGKMVQKGEVQKALGVIDRTWVADIAESIIERNSARALEVLAGGYELGYDLKQMLKDLITHFRNMAISRAVADPYPLIDLPKEEVENIIAQGGKLEPEEIQAVFNILSKAEEQIGRAPDPRLVFEMALLQCIQATPLFGVEEVLKRLELLEKRLGEVSNNNPPASHYQGDAGLISENGVPSLFKNTLNSKKNESFSWSAFLDIAHERGNHKLCSILENVNFLSYENSTLTLEVDKNSIEEQELKDKKHQQLISDIVQEITGEQARIKLISRTPPPKEEKKNKESDFDRAVKKEAKEHPLIKEVENLFGGKILEIKPIHTVDTTSEEE
mgnify:CR=1 FL=1